jgi:hypothetical protein
MAGTKSSGAVFFRAAVMLTFLAAIPLVALSGSSLPDILRKALEKYFPGLSGNNTETTAEGLADAPTFDGTKPTGSAPGSVYASRDQYPGKNGVFPIAAQTSMASSTGASQAAIVPAGGADAGVIPAKYQTPVDGPALPANQAAAEKEDPFLKIQNRLRTLGASYYLLETWGNDQRLYRFYCEMAVAGDTGFTRCFEATNADPIGAMQAVLSQVEDWRTGAK